jgi:hypothetical protein
MSTHKSLVGTPVTAVVTAVLMMSALVLGQDNPDRLTVQFSDPSRPGTLKASLLLGAITVKASSARDVIVVTHPRNLIRRDQPAASSGLRRLGQPAGLTVEEENNVMSIGVGRLGNRADLEIQVPAKTNLRLNTVNGGQTAIEGVEGDIEVTSVNGSINLTDVGGSVVAHATNGKVLATLKQVVADKPMSFTSFNGDVDVTLPSTVKATLKLRSDRGDVYTDFDVQTQPQAARPRIDDSRRSGGRYRIQVDNSIAGSINGGGPEFELRTFNGNIYLRKGN